MDSFMTQVGQGGRVVIPAARPGASASATGNVTQMQARTLSHGQSTPTTRPTGAAGASS